MHKLAIYGLLVSAVVLAGLFATEGKWLPCALMCISSGLACDIIRMQRNKDKKGGSNERNGK
jgi:hypothetical protein